MTDKWKLGIQLTLPVVLACLLAVGAYKLHTRCYQNTRIWHTRYQQLLVKNRVNKQHYQRIKQAITKERAISKLNNKLAKKRQRFKRGLEQLDDIVRLLPMRVALSSVTFDHNGLHCQLQAAFFQAMQAMRQKLAKQSSRCHWLKMVRHNDPKASASLKCDL